MGASGGTRPIQNPQRVTAYLLNIDRKKGDV
jgi:hypothetical protein